MKKLIVIAVLGALLFAGCVRIPEATKGALYSAQLTAAATVQDAEAKTVPPWVIPINETPADKTVRLQQQVDLLRLTLSQINNNLVAVVGWFRTGEEVKNDTE